MSQRDLVILGSSSQVPTRHRNHNGYLLRWDGEGLLFDPGEGTQRQFVFAGVPPTAVTRIFVTHFHGDHSLGLAGMFQRLSLDRVPGPVKVYFPARGRKFLDRLRHATHYDDHLEVEYVPIDQDGLVETGPPFSIEAYALDHAIECFGYRIREPDGMRCDPEALERMGVRGPAVGELLRQGSLEVGGRLVRLEEVAWVKPGSSFAFVMDTRDCAAARTLAEDVDLLVIESTFLDSEARQAEEYGHLTVGQAVAIARDARARNLVLTHFSQRYGDMEPFRAATEKDFPGAILAKDLMKIPFPRREPPLPAPSPAP